MPSRSFRRWSSERASRLDEVRAAHEALGGTGRGRRYATQQVNHAYAVMLSSEFQGFCRDLHSEAADYLADAVHPPTLRTAFRAALTEGRKLDSGNPNAGNLGADFNRFGMSFWPEVLALHAWNGRRKDELDLLVAWRNAIAHHDFDPNKLRGRRTLQLRDIRRWRSMCNALAEMFNRAVGEHVERMIGVRAW